MSAHARNNRTKRALWEYDSIHRSLYLLNYIDSPALRQHVQRALNRGENYHQLCRAVSFASFGKIRFKTAFEQDLWLECSRLIANSIIFYNASILSRLLEHQERIGDMQAADATKKRLPCRMAASITRLPWRLNVKLYLSAGTGKNPLGGTAHTLRKQHE